MSAAAPPRPPQTGTRRVRNRLQTDEDLRRNLIIGGIVALGTAAVGTLGWFIFKRRGKWGPGALGMRTAAAGGSMGELLLLWVGGGCNFMYRLNYGYRDPGMREGDGPSRLHLDFCAPVCAALCR